MLVTFVRHGIGGISTIWKSVAEDDGRVKIIWYQPDSKYFIDANGVFHFDIFTPKYRTFWLLRKYIDSLCLCVSVFVANEEFDLEFLNWSKTSIPIAYIAHVNGDHSYKAAIRFNGIIDSFYAVAAPAVSYLKCRGLLPVEQISYSIKLAPIYPPEKENIIIYLGRFACDKNIEETAAHLEYFKSRGYRAIWVGNGPEELSIRQKSTCELITQITRSELYQLLAKTKFMILSSYCEGLPVIFFECAHFKVIPILSYVDTSCNEILRGSFVLASRDRVATYQAATNSNMVWFDSHPRINNPTVNHRLVSKLLSVSIKNQAKRFQSDVAMFDKFKFSPFASLIAWMRKIRWQTLESQK